MFVCACVFNRAIYEYFRLLVVGKEKGLKIKYERTPPFIVIDKISMVLMKANEKKQ